MSVETGLPGEMSAAVTEGSLVQRFYAGASVLVTGGTGFLGKVLIEKLLWACPDINAIYVLVRNKKGQTAQERLLNMLHSQCFDRLRQSRGPGFGAKLTAVQGDIAEECLGLSVRDRDLLSHHVTIVFHMAATIRFDAPLHVAVTQNVRGTRELLALCRTCAGLKALVHVSTAYSHCPRTDIEERFYDAPMDCDVAIKMAAAGELTPAMTDNLVAPWPNTYSFTKALAEEVVRTHGHGLPVCVFRPAIVVPSRCEPLEGWVDTMAGPSSGLVGYLTGYIRVMPMVADVEFALVPCDMVVDGMIAAAWDLAQNGANKEIPVYNYTPSPSNRISVQNYLLSNRDHMRDFPSSKAIWTPNYLHSSNRTVLFLLRLLLHTLPAGIADAALMLTGRKTFVSRFYSKFDKALDVCSYFARRQWQFQEQNVPALWNKLCSQDKAMFRFDMRGLDWDAYFKRTSPGIRQFILKEDPSTIPAARERLQRILQAKLILKTVLFLIAIYAIVSIVIDSNLFGVLIVGSMTTRPNQTLWITDP